MLSLKEANIVFDFWKDVLSPGKGIPSFLDRLDKDKPLYVVVSHHHKDHYTKRIFEWGKIFRRIHYVLSSDTARYARHILNPDSIYLGPKPAPETVTVLSPGESFSDGRIAIKAFSSTDIGNSYILQAEGKTYFHAGDLNAWVWKDESTEEEIAKSIRDFETIADGIAAEYPTIDYAMFPVDSRIGRDFFTGAYIFVRKIDVRHFFPMHFGLGETPEQQRKFETDASDISAYMNKDRGEYICLQAPYSAFGKAL